MFLPKHYLWLPHFQQLWLIKKWRHLPHNKITLVLVVLKPMLQLCKELRVMTLCKPRSVDLAMVVRTLKLAAYLPSYNKLSTIATRNLLVFLSKPFQDKREKLWPQPGWSIVAFKGYRYLNVAIKIVRKLKTTLFPYRIKHT